jgi:hypothetical protein
MEKKFDLVIVISNTGSDAEKKQLLDNMVKRIAQENSTVGQATAYVSSVKEK